MVVLSLVFALLLQTPAPGAPAAAPQGQQPPPRATPPTPQAPPQPPEAYTYNPDGRRDPFMSLMGAGADQGRGTNSRAEGVAGMTVAEISVRGVLQSRGTMIAMVQGPDNRTYIVRGGDKLADGTVQSVTAEGLVIVQEVNDPLSLVKQRVVRKSLRSLEDSKQ
jgi:type IV pilus assembly protein PilP